MKKVRVSVYSLVFFVLFTCFAFWMSQKIPDWFDFYDYGSVLLGGLCFGVGLLGVISSFWCIGEIITWRSRVSKFKKIFGEVTPDDPSDWKEREEKSLRVFIKIHDLLLEYETHKLQETHALWKSDHETVNQISSVVEMNKNNFRQAQNLAQDFGYKLPNSIEKLGPWLNKQIEARLKVVHPQK